MISIDLALWTISIVLPALIGAVVFQFAHKQMQNMLVRKALRRWEFGLFSAWLGCAPVAYCGFTVYCAMTHNAGYSVPNALFFSYGWSLYVCGPVGAVAAIMPWSLIGRKRRPKVLGCGNHGLPNSRLAGFIPATHPEFKSQGCSLALYHARYRTMLKITRPKVGPPPLTSGCVLEHAPDEKLRQNRAHVANGA